MTSRSLTRPCTGQHRTRTASTVLRAPTAAAPAQPPYTGPIPMVTHVHGAHVNPTSDGYPEAWWLPNAKHIPAGYATNGTFYESDNGADTRMP